MRKRSDTLSCGICEPRDATKLVVLSVSPETSSQLLAWGIFRLRHRRNSGPMYVLTYGDLRLARDILVTQSSSLFSLCFFLFIGVEGICASPL